MPWQRGFLGRSNHTARVPAGRAVDKNATFSTACTPTCAGTPWWQPIHLRLSPAALLTARRAGRESRGSVQGPHRQRRIGQESRVLVWAFAFASMDKRRAGQNVAVAMLATALWALLLVGLAHVNPDLQVVAQLLIVASILVAMAAPLRFADQRREPPDASRKALRSFVASRCICGACVGVCLAAPFSLSSAGSSLPLAAMAVLGLFAVAWMYLHSLETLYAALPALFFLSLGAVFVPFLEGGLWAAAGACTALAWFAWVSFSAFQLSAIKERCGLPELALCLVEKAVLSASIGLGAFAFGLVEHAVGAKVVAAAGPYALFGATLLLVL